VDKGFDLLEQKIKKTAELVRRLQSENKTLAGQLAEAQTKLRQAVREGQEAAASRGPSPEEARKTEALARELDQLRGERQEMKARLARLVEALSALD